MIVVIVGCGRVGSELAHRLQQRGVRVSVIDRTSAAFANLPPDFKGLTIEGNALAEDVLKRARIEQARALAAVTNNDSLNAVVGRIAKTVFSVPRVIVRNYDPRHYQLYETFGLEVVSSSAWGARRLEELLFGESGEVISSFGAGEVKIYAFFAEPRWIGKSLQSIFRGVEAVPVALVRAGKALIPSQNLVLAPGDLLYVSATAQSFRALTNPEHGE